MCVFVVWPYYYNTIIIPILVLYKNKWDLISCSLSSCTKIGYTLFIFFFSLVFFILTLTLASPSTNIEINISNLYLIMKSLCCDDKLSIETVTLNCFLREKCLCATVLHATLLHMLIYWIRGTVDVDEWI